MKALELLLKACSEYNRDPVIAAELFSASMACDDSSQLVSMLSSSLSLPSNDIESLSEAASKASKRLNAKPEKTVLSFY